VKAAKTLAAYVMTCPFVATVLPTARPEIGVATLKKKRRLLLLLGQLGSN
jgi:hypothetical protein